MWIWSPQLLQASGEAEYVSTMPEEHDQLHIEFVLSTVGNATIDVMDASEALVRLHACTECCVLSRLLILSP